MIMKRLWTKRFQRASLPFAARSNVSSLCVIMIRGIILPLILVPSSLFAQVNPSPQVLPPTDLVVKQVTFNPNSRTLVISLSNVGKKPILAYGVSLAFPANASSSAGTSYALNLTEILLNRRSETGSDSSWDGAIRPGETYIDIEAIPTALSAGVQPEAQVNAVLLADGTIQASDSSGIQAMENFITLNQREEVMENRIYTVLTKHQADHNPNQRFSSTEFDLNLLRPDNPNINRLENSSIDRAIANLSILKENLGAEAAFDAYYAHNSSHHARRLTLLGQIGRPKPL